MINIGPRLLLLNTTKEFSTQSKYEYSNGQHKFQNSFLSGSRLLKPGEKSEENHILFVGAKELDLIESYQQAYNIELFDRIVDFGIFYFITKPMFHLLDYLYGVLGNFGLSIMFLTFIIKLLLFPLANKSYRSFAKMKKLAPEITALRESYKDNRLALNQEIMGLYRKHKVNPMSGCLPILLQIPIFFSLYKVLYITIEMRHAPFYLWIKDLSAPDPTSIINLFGLLPWPEYFHIGVLPILMSVSMFIQQKLNPPPTDPIQAKVVSYMPWLFLVLFANFPAGLVLYWVCNNLISIVQQWYITRNVLAEEKALGKNG